MKHFQQAEEFYGNLSEDVRKDLCESIAEDIYFLNDELQQKILSLLDAAVPELSNKIREINSFTI